MFDFDGTKFIIIGIVALLVIGPKDLPRVLRQIGQWTGKLRRMASDFRGQFMDAMREADLDSIKNEVKGVADTARVDTHFDPFGDIRKEIGSIKSELKSSVTGAGRTEKGSDPAPAPALPPPQPSMPPIEMSPLAMNGSETHVLAEPIPVAEIGPRKVLDPLPVKPPPPPRVLSGGIGSLPKSVPSLGTKSDAP